MGDYVEKAMLMDYCLGQKMQVIDCNDITKFPKEDVLEKSEVDKIMDLGGIIKQSKELLWSAYNKGYKQGKEDSQKENCNKCFWDRKKQADDVDVRDKDHIFYKGNQFISLDRFMKVKYGNDNRVAQTLKEKIEQVENEPTGARYWITTKELREILER